MRMYASNCSSTDLMNIYWTSYSLQVHSQEGRPGATHLCRSRQLEVAKECQAQRQSSKRLLLLQSTTCSCCATFLARWMTRSLSPWSVNAAEPRDCWGVSGENCTETTPAQTEDWQNEIAETFWKCDMSFMIYMIPLIRQKKQLRLITVYSIYWNPIFGQ